MMLVAKEVEAPSPPGAVVEAAQRRWAPPSTMRVSPRGGSPVAVGDLWLRTRGGGGPGSASQHGSHESDMDLAMLVSDFLEGSGGGDSRGSNDGEPGGLHDLAHLADKISVRTSRLHPVPRLLSSALLCSVRVDFAFWLWGQGVEQAVQKRDNLDDRQKHVAYVAGHTLYMSRGGKFNRDDKKKVAAFLE
ncbi:hypothetical protein ZWY2020_018993 [Hordeum vulgare]|nr:hypothetical protein ZWY2020_018993 [Hordeum vulgare]